ncbi:hypothetical protein EDB19DRAFT_1833906 [Suillus lakei]|nr:hypothetical protein EDB19DRAFT_1833906 [Suillus lakei]
MISHVPGKWYCYSSHLTMLRNGINQTPVIPEDWALHATNAASAWVEQQFLAHIAVKLDIDIIRHNEALTKQESGMNDAQEKALLARFPPPKKLLLDRPSIVIDSGYQIILWYIPNTLSPWVQNDMTQLHVSPGLEAQLSAFHTMLGPAIPSHHMCPAINYAPLPWTQASQSIQSCRPNCMGPTFYSKPPSGTQMSNSHGQLLGLHHHPVPGCQNLYHHMGPGIKLYITTLGLVVKICAIIWAQTSNSTSPPWAWSSKSIPSYGPGCQTLHHHPGPGHQNPYHHMDPTIGSILPPWARMWARMSKYLPSYGPSRHFYITTLGPTVTPISPPWAWSSNSTPSCGPNHWVYITTLGPVIQFHTITLGPTINFLHHHMGPTITIPWAQLSHHHTQLSPMGWAINIKTT